MTKKLSIIGSLLNLIGIVLLAFSLNVVAFTGLTFGTLEDSGTIITPYASTINPYFFYGGLAVMFLGFLLQLIEKIKK